MIALALALLAPVWAGTLTIDLLDVGQGDAILLTSPAGKRVLIDGGEARADVVDQLHALGVGELALVVGTHPHADHIGGLFDVMGAIPVKMYVDSGMAHTTATYNRLMERIEESEIRYQPARKDQIFRLDDGITIEVLWPTESLLKGTRSDLNSNSVVLRVEHGETCLLLTGDAEADTERALVAGGLETCGILKVAHHGSHHSTTDDFLAAVDPQIALISAGQNNRYDHPGEETIEKLRAAGVTIYRTDENSLVRLESDGSEVRVTDGLPSAH